MGSEQLPHSNIEENPTIPSKKRVFFIAVFSFLLLSLPVGVYLVQQQQQISSRAANENLPIEQRSISLTTANLNVGEGQIVPVNIQVRSDNQTVTMAEVTIQFNPSKVKVIELITNPAQNQNNVFFGKYWLSKGYDNDQGKITLIVGSPQPGVKTTPGDQGLLLAQVRFLTIGEGEADITLAEETYLYSTENTESVPDKNNLTFIIQKEAALPGSGATDGYQGSILSRFSELQPSSSIKNPLIQTSPEAGEVFFYFRPVEITWNGDADTIKSLILYLNGEPFGVIAENLANNGSYTWTPSLSIPLPMIVPENTYSFQIVGQTKDNNETKSEGNIPFGIISDPNGKITIPAFQPKNPASLAVESGAKILSRWGEKLASDDELDLNNDLVINYLDWYLLRKALFVKDLVY